MSLFELACCIDGWNAVHGAEAPAPESMTPAEFDAFMQADDLD